MKALIGAFKFILCNFFFFLISNVVYIKCAQRGATLVRRGKFILCN
jgi:hypothetical protein